jgi:glutathione S-transferase
MTASAPPPTIDIFGRQSSHYTRLVRLLAHELGLDVGFQPIHDLLSHDPATFAGNPALKLPAVRVDGETIWGSLNACRRLARRVDGGEARVFWPEDAHDPLLANAHEIVAHTMAVQVEVIVHEVLAKRPEDAVSRKRRQSLLNCLDWLDAHLDTVRAALPADRIALIELQLFCLLEFLAFRYPVDMSDRPRLQAFADGFRERPSAQATPYRFDGPPPEAAATR